METETQNKHSQKLKLIKVLKQIRNILKRSLNLIILNVVFHQFCKPPSGETSKFTEKKRSIDQRLCTSKIQFTTFHHIS